MRTITIREQPNGLLTILIGRDVVEVGLTAAQALAIAESEIAQGGTIHFLGEDDA